MAANVRRSTSSKSKKKGERSKKLKKIVGGNSTNGNGEELTDESGRSRLGQNTRDYLCQIENIVDDGFLDQDDKEVFITNVFNSVSGEEISMAEDADASRVLEKILLCCDARQVTRYIERISEGLAGLCADRCGSHVVQTLLEVIREHQCRIAEDGKKERLIYDDFILQIVDVVCADLEELLVHKYASHVICSLAETLTNTSVSANIHQSRKSHRHFEKAVDYGEGGGMTKMASYSSVVDKKFKSYFKRLVKAIQQLGNFRDLAKNPHSSTVLQTIVLALSVVNADSCEQFVTALARCLSESEEGLTVSSTDPYCAHLIEKLIDVSTPKLFEKLITENFVGNLRELALNSGANFIVQRLFKHCSSKPLLEKMYAELEDSWNVIANEGHFGVLTSMSEACVRLKACQVKFVADLTKLLKCTDSDDPKMRFVLLVAQLVSRDEWCDASEEQRCELNVKYHGSLLVQNLLRFQDTHRVVSNLTEMSISDLEKLFCNSYGSYIMDAFASSDTVSTKSRSKVIRHLADSVVNFACDKYGSRCLEALWHIADAKLKKLMVDKLAASEERLRGDRFGAFALNACAVSLFKRRPSEWAEWQAKRDQKRKVFDEFFENATDNRRKCKVVCIQHR